MNCLEALQALRKNTQVEYLCEIEIFWFPIALEKLLDLPFKIASEQEYRLKYIAIEPYNWKTHGKATEELKNEKSI